MARGKKTGGKDWKPGQSGNPKGPPKVPPEVREARKFNKQVVSTALERVLSMNEAELKKFMMNKSQPVIERALAKVLYKAMTQANLSNINFLLDRTIGKVPNNHKVEGMSGHAGLVAYIKKHEQPGE